MLLFITTLWFTERGIATHARAGSSLKRCQHPCAVEYFSKAPDKWLADFRRVMGNLTPHLGFFDIDITAWPSSDDAPTIQGQTLQRGQYVSARIEPDGVERTLMVLEIDLNELEQDHPHRLSVIAHEYFHVYQRFWTPKMNEEFRIKWLIEGTAAVLESMYLNEFEQVSNYFQTAQLRHAKVEDFGPKMEHYDNAEVNYGTSTAMVLFACREVGFQRMIDFWKKGPANHTWKRIFAETFGVTVQQLYTEGKTAELNQLSLTAMGELSSIKF